MLINLVNLLYHNKCLITLISIFQMLTINTITNEQYVFYD